MRAPAPLRFCFSASSFADLFLSHTLPHAIVQVGQALAAKADLSEMEDKLRDKVTPSLGEGERREHVFFEEQTRSHPRSTLHNILSSAPVLSPMAQPSRRQVSDALAAKANSAAVDQDLRQFRQEVSDLTQGLVKKAETGRVDEVSASLHPPLLK